MRLRRFYCPLLLLIPVLLIFLLSGCSNNLVTPNRVSKTVSKKKIASTADKTGTTGIKSDLNDKERTQGTIASKDALYDVQIKRPLHNARLIVNKEKRELLLYENDRLVKIYHIGLGKDPVGDKERQGDGRTPEGKFYVCSKNPESKFHLSLGVSYPNMEDARRGLEAGLINKEQYEKIVRAIKSGRRPPWNTALGGAICIHGGGSKWDWTLGCIALDNKDIEEIYRVVPVGTPIIIY